MQINSKDKIIDYFTQGNKKDLKIGVENEKFLFKKTENKRVNYSEILNIFKFFIEKFKWEKILENNHLVGLKNKGKSITLEPGNQIELSGAQFKNIHEVCAESYKFQSELNEICESLDLYTLAVGYDPISKLEEVSDNPKQRYKIMLNEMPKNGKYSLDMMYLTSGTQINIDYLSEFDFKKKFKVLNYLCPLTIALFANSSIKEKKFSGYLSFRSRVWQETARGGLPEIFLEEMDFEKYTDFLINVPMLFYKKDDLYFSAKDKTFKDFMDGNIEERKKRLPLVEDLELHLSTIFTENRLKKYIEIRSVDACEWDCHCAGPAFLTGLIYGNLEETYEVLKEWKRDEILNAYYEAPKKGLNTSINNKSILEWSKIFLDISKKGLEKRNHLNQSKKNETIYLKNINKIIEERKTKADKTLEDLNLHEK